MSYNVHNFRTGDTIEAPPINEMDAQILQNYQDIAGKINTSEKGSMGGVASLDANAKVPTSQLPVATTLETQAIIDEYTPS